MSFNCNIHQWQHLFKACPACQQVQIVGNASIAQPFFGVDRTTQAYRLSDKYIPEKLKIMDRLRAAWNGFKYGPHG